MHIRIRATRVRQSFGVKQIAASIGETAIKEMVYNLSQADSPHVLPMMFHKIRDEALKGMVPRSSLMNSILLSRASSSGGSIFPGPDAGWRVPGRGGDAPDREGNLHFCPGTCQSYDEFFKRSRRPGVKVPDFISRLKGYMNIKGCNPSGYNDQFYLIRRAMLFCTIIQRERAYLISRNGEMAIILNLSRPL